MVVFCFILFFFKQKTAYEMRISDWSSDVCSSDVALAVLVLGRTGRIDQRCIDDGALAQRQAAVAQIAIDDSEDASRQLVFLQQAAAVENSGFVGDALQVQPGKLAQDRGFVQSLQLGSASCRASVCEYG